MKNFLLLCILFFSFSYCSNEPSKPSPDVEYDLENVRVLVPREYQKFSSKKEVKESLLGGTDSISFQNQYYWIGCSFCKKMIIISFQNMKMDN